MSFDAASLTIGFFHRPGQSAVLSAVFLLLHRCVAGGSELRPSPGQVRPFPRLPIDFGPWTLDLGRILGGTSRSPPWRRLEQRCGWDAAPLTLRTL